MSRSRLVESRLAKERLPTALLSGNPVWDGFYPDSSTGVGEAWPSIPPGVLQLVASGGSCRWGPLEEMSFQPLPSAPRSTSSSSAMRRSITRIDELDDSIPCIARAVLTSDGIHG